MQQMLRLTLQRTCVPLVSLRAFNPAPAAAPQQAVPPPAARGQRSYTRGAKRRAERVIAAARRQRGNMFLDPSNLPQENSLADLYDSSRFNQDDSDDEDFATQPTTAAAEDGEDEGHIGPDDDGELLPLPPARNTRVRTAEFIKSSVSVSQCPPARFPEFAVIGRSNVGKSSLINLLTNRASLALVSKQPGKTRCINHFLINGAWYLVDLPGYGYARTSKENVVNWNAFTREYFLERETLAAVLLLVDASIPPMPLDVACAQWFAEAEIPYTVVFTKTDKRKKGVPPAVENIAAFEQELAQAVDVLPPTLLTSSRSGQGKAEVLAHIAQIRELYNRTAGTRSLLGKA